MTDKGPPVAVRHQNPDEADRQAHALTPAGDAGEGAACRVDSHPALERTLARLGGTSVNYAALVDLLGCPRDDPHRVAESLHRCPALAARVLSLANSASVGVSGEVRSLRRAVMLLGASVARQVGLAHALRASIQQAALPRDLAERLWSSAIRKACLAQRFCQTVAPELADEAFTVGLIQDIGLPPLVAVDPAFYTERLGGHAAPGLWARHEREHFGICHGAIGNGLLLEWGAGAVVQLDVLNHHRAPAPGDPEPALLKLAAYLASGLPHLDEPTDARADRWMHAAFTKFLATDFASPEAFMLAAANDAAEMIHNPGEKRFRAAPTSQEGAAAIREVAGGDLAVLSRLVRLENLLEQRSDECGDLRHEAFTDPLTRVLNRRGFMRLAPLRVEQARHHGNGVCCLLVDLNRFKPINDTYGHHMGDLFLKGVGKVLRKNLQRRDLVARFGGDEFMALVGDVTEDQARDVAGRLAAGINRARLRLREGLEFTVSAAVGAAFTATALDEPALIETLLRLADEAMYTRKAARDPRPGFVVHNPA